MAASDLVLVSNEDDYRELTSRHGLDSDRVAVVTPGFDKAVAEALGRVALGPMEEPPIIAFIGTFDERKGGGDFPALVDSLAHLVPGVRFRLLGTRGMLQTKEAVLQRFPRQQRKRIEVVPSYDPEALPSLLAGCAAGVFPSYAEGFGYGVLEMLAAGLPVVAYDRPGPPVMLSKEFLVPVGRPDLLASTLASLLADGRRLAQGQAAARARVQQFNWERAANLTLGAYQEAIDRRISVIA
jgi:glycosyltransferase involved in cell wall biosynthesis